MFSHLPVGKPWKRQLFLHTANSTRVTLNGRSKIPTSLKIAFHLKIRLFKQSSESTMATTVGKESPPQTASHPWQLKPCASPGHFCLQFLLLPFSLLDDSSLQEAQFCNQDWLQIHRDIVILRLYRKKLNTFISCFKQMDFRDDRLIPPSFEHLNESLAIKNHYLLHPPRAKRETGTWGHHEATNLGGQTHAHKDWQMDCATGSALQRKDLPT